jgi:hypothetical protein
MRSKAMPEKDPGLWSQVQTYWLAALATMSAAIGYLMKTKVGTDTCGVCKDGFHKDIKEIKEGMNRLIDHLIDNPAPTNRWRRRDDQ